MLKPDCWVIKAQSNANSHARVVIPGKYLVPVSPRSGKHYSFSSKCNLFSELVSVWSSRILFSIISLDSVLLESTKPQGCLLQVTESDDEQLKNRSMFETSRNRTQLHKAKCSSEERAWSRWRKRAKGVRDHQGTATLYKLTPLTPKLQLALTCGALGSSTQRLVFYLFLGSSVSPPFLLPV